MSGKSGSGKSDSTIVSFPFPPDELLAQGLVALGFPAVDGHAGAGALAVRGIGSIIPLVNRYVKELELFNAVFDLVGAETRSDLIVRHILDSLAPWKEIAAALSDIGTTTGSATNGLVPDGTAPRQPHIADAGSGAGFPGIPLAIVFPDFRFTLIERMSKRCAFLENCTAILGLKNVTVLNSEVEKAPAAAYDLVVFRAFRPLDQVMINTLLRLTAPGGRLAAYKAKKDKITEEMSALKNEIDGWEALPLAVPFLGHEERHLVLTSLAKRLNRPS